MENNAFGEYSKNLIEGLSSSREHKYNSTSFDKLIRGKNINFLIGSGASTPFYPTLKLNNFSFEEVVSNIDSDALKKFMYVYYYLKCIKPMDENLNVSLENLGGVKENLEQRLEKETDEKIELEEKLDKVKQKLQVPAYYMKFVKLLYSFLQNESNDKPKRINIFTTNYDLFFERTIDRYIVDNPLVYFNDGSRGVFEKHISNSNFYLNVTHSGYNDNYRREVPTINLFKLHGSLSWKLDDDKILVEEHNALIGEIDALIEEMKLTLELVEGIINYNENEVITKYIEHIDTEVSKLKLKEQKLNKFYEMYKKLAIVNPDKYKFHETVSEQHYYQIIRSFSYELERQQAVLIVFGFSFADEHILEIFKRSLLNPELLVVIICYSKITKNEMKKKFGNYKNTIIFLPEEYEHGRKGDFKYLLSLLGDEDYDGKK